MSHNKKPSLTEKYLPKDLWKWMSIKTSFGTTIYDCIKSALENPDSNVGLYAPGTRIRKKIIKLKFY
jgi:creatine kinase